MTKSTSAQETTTWLDREPSMIDIERKLMYMMKESFVLLGLMKWMYAALATRIGNKGFISADCIDFDI